MYYELVNTDVCLKIHGANFQRLSKDKSSGSDAEDENEDSGSEQVL